MTDDGLAVPHTPRWFEELRQMNIDPPRVNFYARIKEVGTTEMCSKCATADEDSDLREYVITKENHPVTVLLCEPCGKPWNWHGAYGEALRPAARSGRKRVCMFESWWESEVAPRCGRFFLDGAGWSKWREDVTCEDCQGFCEISGFHRGKVFTVLDWQFNCEASFHEDGTPFADHYYDGHLFKLADEDGQLYYWSTNSSHNLQRGVRFQTKKYRIKAIRRGFPTWITQVHLWNEMRSYPPSTPKRENGGPTT